MQQSNVQWQTGWDGWTPLYDERLRAFFTHLADNHWWHDHQYSPTEGGALLASGEGMQNTTIAQLRVMLAFCLRGERFSSGF